jgi:hypothetical protein
MVNVKLKLYCVSLSAAKATDAIGSDQGQLYWEHNAAIITSVDMETVRSQAQIIAFDSWPFDDGWSMHSAAVTEITGSFINEVLSLRQAGLLSNDPVEPHQFFQFQPPEAATH